MKNKLIVILGATATGKSDLAVKLAKKFGGEIISVDSRQVYKSLDVGSGKITKKEMRGVPHHLLDIASPKRKFTVAKFQRQAFKKIEGIQKRGSVPFLVGGTGLYIQSVVDGLAIPEVPPNWQLRKKLENKSAEELFSMLKKLDPERAKSIADPKNSRRLIRAIEIAKTLRPPTSQEPQESLQKSQNIEGSELSILQIGIRKSPEELKKAIKKQQRNRLNRGMIEEVKKLHRNGLSWKRLEELGLEYRLIAQYLQGKISTRPGLAETSTRPGLVGLVEKLEKEIWQFAKRQMTWFKRDKRIRWINNYREAEKLVKEFLV